MVPANYLEIFHSHAPAKNELADLDYAVPKSKTKLVVPSSVTQLSGGIPLHELQTKYADYDIPRGTPVSQEIRDEEGSIYDNPPQDENEEDPTNRDYDLPPPDEIDFCERPPSAKSSRSGMSNRHSATSMGSSGLYDIPPSPSGSGLYDLPPRDLSPSLYSGRQTSSPLDVSEMDETEAEELLSVRKKDMEQEFDNLWKCVYSNDAYWGSENKTRRSETLRRTVTAAKKFERALYSIVSFGKGVSRSLENSKDANFKRKFTASNNIIASKRQEVLAKIDVLVVEDEKDAPITTTVKMLLEVARSVPQAVHAFTILVMANKVILFRPSPQKPDDSLPVMTKTEVKARPLPEVPASQTEKPPTMVDCDADYAIADEPPPKAVSPTPMPTEWTASISRRRNPHDDLPPLPYATLRKPPGKRQPLQIASPSQSVSSLRIVNAPRDVDYDDIDGPNPSPARHLAAPPAHLSRAHLHRQSSGSIQSASSDESHSPKRGNSPDHLNGTPYGYIMNNGMNLSRAGSPLPLRQEDRDLLNRYSQQMDLLVPSLREAMEGFILSVRNNEPPKQFVTKSKMVVVAAYKLVYIADSLYQKILHNDTKTALVASSNSLTESIKALVSDTKTAALQHPSVIAMSRMIESLKKLFPTAMDLVNTVKCPSSISLV